MSKNLYWSVFKNLEKEIITLSNQIHFDDKQLKIYSIKISELLIRTVVEIESISKELYFINGGSKPDDNKLYFDTDCIALLEKKLLLSKKVVLVTSPNFYFKSKENKILTPLKKANKRGTSSSDWLKAYQAIKHNRAKNLENGNIKHLIKALAGLYILNLYYRDTAFELENASGTNFGNNVGSEIFSIKLHSIHTFQRDQVTGKIVSYDKNPDYDECVYIIRPSDDTRIMLENSMKKFYEKTQKLFFSNIKKELEKNNSQLNDFGKNNDNEKLKELINNIQSDSMIQVAKGKNEDLLKAASGLKYEAILNKQQ